MYTTDNRASWQEIVETFSLFAANPDRPYLTPVRRLVKTVSASERASKFRAGQSLFTLIISTTAYHGLKRGDAFVTVDVDPGGIENGIATPFVISYWISHSREEKWSSHVDDWLNRWQSGHDRARQWMCSEDELLPTLDIALEQLWANTRGSA